MSKCEVCGSAFCVISDCGAPMPVVPCECGRPSDCDYPDAPHPLKFDRREGGVNELPRWVWDLVIAIKESEDQHPQYYGDFCNGLQRLNQCPESRFLALIPESIKGAAVHRADERRATR